MVHYNILGCYQWFPILPQDMGPVHNLTHIVKCVDQPNQYISQIIQISQVMHVISICMTNHILSYQHKIFYEKSYVKYVYIMMGFLLNFQLNLVCYIFLNHPYENIYEDRCWTKFYSNGFYSNDFYSTKFEKFYINASTYSLL